MKKALLVVALSYGFLLALFATAACALAVFRTKIIGGFTVGDVAVVLAVLIYGLFIYTAGLYVKRVTCNGRRRDT
ncbi:hypothetical protein ODS41_01815 [Pyrobaculum sp. 3827-6]|uniref:hypothetical protein n=1 Tax=Pyrobaculum sp. 3827-6 TaxID=2983604 RepID=UPI0021DA9E55|nr:hypothetical protein [Pyrobaculum sp. 3827-6]MCU7786667.1 hypothetical protein [Pyrobaculum sp. 3827-6]